MFDSNTTRDFFVYSFEMIADVHQLFISISDDKEIINIRRIVIDSFETA
jgi:hypothetical protein